MVDEPDYILEIDGKHIDPESDEHIPHNAEISAKKAGNRKKISVFFECCNAYQHIYRNLSQTAYIGRCPKCLRQVYIKIGPGGTDQRFFTAK